jgi:hypothetical protein
VDYGLEPKLYGLDLGIEPQVLGLGSKKFASVLFYLQIQNLPVNLNQIIQHSGSQLLKYLMHYVTKLPDSCDFLLILQTLHNASISQ